MFDHFCLDMVGLVLSEFVWSGLVELSQKKDNKGLKYRVAAQLKSKVPSMDYLVNLKSQRVKLVVKRNHKNCIPSLH